MSLTTIQIHTNLKTNLSYNLNKYSNNNSVKKVTITAYSSIHLTDIHFAQTVSCLETLQILQCTK